MSIYREIILDHYRNPRNFGRIENPTKTVSVNNPLCGDVIHLDLLVKDDVVENVKFSAEGCAISLASASLLTEHIKGKTKDSLINIDKDFIINMLGVELSPNRLKCALLSLEALRKTISTQHKT